MGNHFRKRILFFGEAATLSHVLRPWILATGLDSQQYQVIFCCDPRYQKYLPSHPSVEQTETLHSASTEQFLRNLHRGMPIFDQLTFERYVQQDLDLIDRYQPDLVVGDLRLSLLISTRLRGVHYINLCNAYWDPQLNPKVLLPDIPLRRILGRFLGQPIFEWALPRALHWQMAPLNRVAKKHGLSRLGMDIRQAYTSADTVLYCDPPSLFPLSINHKMHAFIGPIRLPHYGPLPSWWEIVPADRPVIFATLGSSGNIKVLDGVLSTLSGMNLTTIVATLGRKKLKAYPNVYYADFLPVGVAAARSALTICNGGSSLAYEAIASGSAVLGIPSNMDQYLSLHYLKSAGVAQICETPDVSRKMLTSLVEDCLGNKTLASRVQTLKVEITSLSAPEHFNQILGSYFNPAKKMAA